MKSDRKIKSVIVGIIDDTGTRRRPDREWLDVVRNWCQKDIHFLCIIAQDREKWKSVVKCAVDTNGLLPMVFDDDDSLELNYSYNSIIAYTLIR
jgi:hypothetical protein